MTKFLVTNTYIDGICSGQLVFKCSDVMKLKKNAKNAILVIYNHLMVDMEGVVNANGIIIFEDCMTEELKELFDKLHYPVVIVSHEEVSIVNLSLLVNNNTNQEIAKYQNVDIDNGVILGG